MKFIVIDADYTYSRSNEPIIRLYGKKVGNVEVGAGEGVNVGGSEDIVVHVYGFEPYIYLDLCGLEANMLKDLITKELRGYIKRIEVVSRYKPMGYQGSKSDMLKLVMYNPRVVPEVRKLLVEKIEEISDDKIYEADVLFRDRFLIDRGIDGMSVVEFNEAGKKIENYGIGCGVLYMVSINELRVCDDIVKIEY